MTAREKVKAADQATSKVYEARRALELLNKSYSNNGYGILHDPQRVKVDLLRAQSALTVAIDALALALKNWPQDRDYEEYEAQANREFESDSVEDL